MDWLADVAAAAALAPDFKRLATMTNDVVERVNQDMEDLLSAMEVLRKKLRGKTCGMIVFKVPTSPTFYSNVLRRLECLDIQSDILDVTGLI